MRETKFSSVKISSKLLDCLAFTIISILVRREGGQVLTLPMQNGVKASSRGLDA